MYRLVLMDDVTGKTKRGPSSAGVGAFFDQDFDVGVGGQSNFVCSTTFGSTNTLDVFVNGRKAREGATNDFTRNISLNRIEFNNIVAAGAWVSIRVYAS